MSVLALQLPSRPRLAARAAADSAAPAAAQLPYVLSPDGLQVAAQGQAQPHQLPRADTVVAVLADADVGWQRITLPKAPASRLRAALAGLLEEQLLEDEATLHLALQPQAVVGQPAWVAAVDKRWLQGQLERLEKAGVFVDRVVPASWPGDTAQGRRDGPFTDRCTGVIT